MIIPVWNIQNGQIHSDRLEAVRGWGWGSGRWNRGSGRWGRGSGRWGILSETKERWLHNIMNMLNATELYSLEWLFNIMVVSPWKQPPCG